MLKAKYDRMRWALFAMAAGVGLAGLMGCQHTDPVDAATARHAVPYLVPGQESFATEQDAVRVLADAAKAQDKATLQKLFGPAMEDMKSGDPVEDTNELKAFSSHVVEQIRLEKKSDTAATLYIGKNDWPFPIPLVKTSDGRWFFDTNAGKSEILARRIGTDELETIKVCRAYVDAQREYAREDHNGNGVLKYAQRLISTPGRRDGLYWPAKPGEDQSPLGPLAAQATMEGYNLDTPHFRRAYHGYNFHILKQQGSAAPGGKYDYVINGNMIAGFALVACPNKYGSSGIMTFIVNHQGLVYQKDFGPNTSRIVREMKEYNPDQTWILVKDQ